jgi:hypothetical protein
MKSIFLIFLAISAAVAIANAAETREIELTDGSVITGEVVSLSRGVYTVRSATLGTVRIEESKVRTIRSKSSTSTTGDTGSRVKALQDKMMSDSEIIDMIRSLQNDPDVQKILRDPEIMKAVQTGDISTLMANPQFMKLLNNQAVQKIRNRIAK